MKYVYPVIHHLNWQTTRVEATVAFNGGADGIFLISHGGQDTELLSIAHEIKLDYPNKKVGLNLLGFDAVRAYHMCYGLGLDMMWTDRPGIASHGVNETARHLEALDALCKERVQVFASVAFKYQPTESDPPKAAERADARGFIATTSGVGTGHAPEVSKIQSMSVAVEGNLAIASGMTPENVHLFTPYVNHFLVSTGISKDEYRLDPLKLQAFCDIVHAAID